MDWQCFVDAGILHPAPTGKIRTSPMIRRAWQRVVDADDASRVGDWETTDREIKKAFCVASEALVCYHELDLLEDCDFETAERFGVHFFGEELVTPMFDRARNMRKMMPMERKVPEMQQRKVRDCVAASSAYVALVECFTYR